MLEHRQTMNMDLIFVMVLFTMIFASNQAIMPLKEGWEKLNGDLGLYDEFDVEIRGKFQQKYNETLGNITEVYQYKPQYSEKLGEYQYMIYYSSDLGPVQAEIIIRRASYKQYYQFHEFTLLDPPAGWAQPASPFKLQKYVIAYVPDIVKDGLVVKRYPFMR